MNGGIGFDFMKSLTQSEDITSLTADKLVSYFREDEQICNYLPEIQVARDPRTDNYVVFNAKRASRPKDNTQSANREIPECVICSGKTTGILDLKKLSSGYTFINKNLFPILYPHDYPVQAEMSAGFHFLQWTSSFHDNDWTNMPVKDLAVVLGRTAAVEGWLLENSSRFFQETGKGWVSVIKNYGKAVGGSLKHDHQQIGFSSVMPGRVKRNIDFLNENGMSFSSYLLAKNPSSLTLKDYGTVKLVVPYYMERPLNMTLIVKESGKDFLFQLDDKEISDTAQAWSDAVSAIMEIMPAIGREPAFNIVSNTGAGIYFDFLPFTQEFGGFEHSGLYLCQMTPDQAHRLISEKIEKRSYSA